MVVQRDSLLRTIHRELPFSALCSLREFQICQLLCCYSGRTAVKGIIIYFPPDDPHLSHLKNFLKKYICMQTLIHLIFYYFLLHCLLSPQPHFQIHILPQYYNLYLSSFCISTGFVLCTFQIFFPQLPPAPAYFFYLYPFIVFFCHIILDFYPLVQISAQLKSLHNHQA